MLDSLDVGEKVGVNHFYTVMRQGLERNFSNEPSGILGSYNLDVVTGLSEKSNEACRFIRGNAASDTNDYVSQFSFTV